MTSETVRTYNANLQLWTTRYRQSIAGSDRTNLYANFRSSHPPATAHTPGMRDRSSLIEIVHAIVEWHRRGGHESTAIPRCRFLAFPPKG